MRLHHIDQASHVYYQVPVGEWLARWSADSEVTGSIPAQVLNLAMKNNTNHAAMNSYERAQLLAAKIYFFRSPA